jgi:hypothetical protein
VPIINFQLPHIGAEVPSVPFHSASVKLAPFHKISTHHSISGIATVLTNSGTSLSPLSATRSSLEVTVVIKFGVQIVMQHKEKKFHRRGTKSQKGFKKIILDFYS